MAKPSSTRAISLSSTFKRMLTFLLQGQRARWHWSPGDTSRFRGRGLGTGNLSAAFLRGGDEL